MARQEYDLELRRYNGRGWRAMFFPAGFEHSFTSHAGSGWAPSPWQAVQHAARDALDKLQSSEPPMRGWTTTDESRRQPDDSGAPVFTCRYAQADKFFPKAIERAQAALRAAGRDGNRLDGYTWHGNRHTFASRLVMAGVDPRTVQELGGWRTLGMVQRYSHLAPEHLHSAVERLVAGEATEVARK